MARAIEQLVRQGRLSSIHRILRKRRRFAYPEELSSWLQQHYELGCNRDRAEWFEKLLKLPSEELQATFQEMGFKTARDDKADRVMKRFRSERSLAAAVRELKKPTDIRDLSSFRQWLSRQRVRTKPENVEVRIRRLRERIFGTRVEDGVSFYARHSAELDAAFYASSDRMRLAAKESENLVALITATQDFSATNLRRIARLMRLHFPRTRIQPLDLPPSVRDVIKRELSAFRKPPTNTEEVRSALKAYRRLYDPAFVSVLSSLSRFEPERIRGAMGLPKFTYSKPPERKRYVAPRPYGKTSKGDAPFKRASVQRKRGAHATMDLLEDDEGTAFGLNVKGGKLPRWRGRTRTDWRGKRMGEEVFPATVTQQRLVRKARKEVQRRKQ